MSWRGCQGLFVQNDMRKRVNLHIFELTPRDKRRALVLLAAAG